jgi:HlyD family secretion protein
MINNSRPAATAFALLVFAAGCTAAGAERAPLQGVVELDDRVIGFELGGRVVEVAVQRGQSVTSGAVLARLDDGLERPLRDLRAAELAAARAEVALLRRGARREDLRAAEAEIAALRAEEQTLAKNVERQDRLQAVGAAPVATLDDVSAELRATGERRGALEQRLRALRSGARAEEIAAAEARAQAAAAALAAIEARLVRYILRSPAPGSAVDVHVEVGEIVAPGTPALTLADLDHPFVDVFVPQSRMTEVAIGKGASVRVDGAPRALGGVVEHVFPRTEFTPRFLFSEGERPNLVVRVRVRVNDPEHLLHAGVPAFVTLRGRGG